MSEQHHTTSNETTPLHSNEAQSVPAFRSQAERDAFVEQVFAERQAARRQAEAQRAADQDNARGEVSDAFAGSENQPRIVKGAPRISRIIEHQPVTANETTEPAPLTENHDDSADTRPPAAETKFDSGDEALIHAQVHLEEVRQHQANSNISKPSHETDRVVAEADVAVRQLESMIDELSKTESKKNGMIDATSGAFQRLKNKLGDGQIRDRNQALLISRDIEQLIGTLKGAQAAENHREKLAHDAQVVIAHADIEVTASLEQNIDSLRRAGQFDERGNTTKSADLVVIMNRMSDVAANIYGQPSGAITHAINQILTQLEAQQYPRGTKSDLGQALEAIKNSL